MRLLACRMTLGISLGILWLSVFGQQRAGEGIPQPALVEVVPATAQAESLPLRDLPGLAPLSEGSPREGCGSRPLRGAAPEGSSAAWRDDTLAAPSGATLAEASGTPSPLGMPTATTYAGLDIATSGCGCLPSDANGDVGPTQYVEVVNTSYAVYNKATGAQLATGTLQNLFTPMGGWCGQANNWYPTVLYDRAADRWVIAQAAYSSTTPYPDQSHACVAVSKTGDATGAYWLYDFLLSGGTVLADSPQFGIWLDGYYMSTYLFASGNYQGPAASVLNRSAMLTGAQATMIRFTLPATYYGFLPSDMEGATPPPAGAPNYFMEPVGLYLPGDTQSYLKIWKFHADWANPVNSTFGVAGAPNFTLPVANFTEFTLAQQNTVPQAGTANLLDNRGQQITNRLSYRNFGAHESLTATKTTNAGSGRAGIRWWEVRDLSTTPTVYQEQTYAPADTLHRWVGSSSMNKLGALALGFSRSDGSSYPSLAIAGRRASDPLGTLAQGEALFFAGTASQTVSHRWGDFFNLKVDPTDDCTFWFTGQYATGGANWATRWGSFRMGPAAPAAPTFTAVGCTGLTVNWAASAEATSYDIYRSLGSGCAGAVKVNAAPVTGLSYTDSGLTTNQSYSYSVTASDACGASASPCAPVTTAYCACAAPGAPTLTGAVASCSGVALSWTAGSGTTAIYNIYRSTKTTCPVGTVTKLNASPLAATTLSYFDATGVAGTTYTYVVRASCDGGGLSLSANSNCLAAARVAIPAAPAIPTFSPVGCSTLTVNWATVPGATSYYLFRMQGASCAGAGQIAGPLGVTSYSDVGLTASTQYRYFVTASNVCGFSAAGACGTVTTTPPPVAVPTGLAATSACGSLTLAWNASSGATGYTVSRGSVCGGAENTFLTGTNSFTDYGATPGTVYQYWVQAQDFCGASAASACVEGHALGPMAPPAAPAVVTATCDAVTLGWPASPDATSYALYREPGGACTSGMLLANTSNTYFTDTGLSASTQYAYSLVASNGCTTSPIGACGAMTTPATCEPGEVAPGTMPALAQTWSDKQTMAWPSSSGANFYTVYWGLQADLPGLLDSTQESCSYSQTGSTTLNGISEDPASKLGRFYWFLLTASNFSGEGVAGDATAGPRQVNLKFSNCPP